MICTIPGCQTTAGCKCRKIVTRARPDLGPGYFDLVEDGRKLTTVLTIPRWAAVVDTEIARDSK